MIRTATPADAPAICRIYAPFIRDTTITFEEEPVPVAEMERRITTTTANYPWLVLDTDAGVIGYAYATRWRERHAYRYTVETAIYLAPEAQGKGLGAPLYTALLAALRERGSRVAMGVIALPNASSVALHERLGFHKAGHFERVGYKFDRWIDVGLWQLML
ncbi:MAG TPA: arsinothricin resistance N-acetyltransferase ArsN1 family B [Flavobacteriales bacterium]|jgi:phosphinothricin acetyltransferase|nr:arsinothricin resistance N-acetyltransferase ArsN1 family B [Flavobacteriales bacterium]